MLKLLKNRKLIFISLSSLMILSAIIILIFTFNSNKKSKDPKFVYNSGHYVTDLTPISTSSLSSNYIKMNTLYTNSGSTITRTSATIDSTKTIAIESAMDFYAFGWLANNSTGFLGYKYELLANIDMNDAYEMYPIGYQNTAFTGNFNGNGHLIKNLHLTPVTQQNSSEFNSTHYYALFCQNSGTVGNFGLIDPIISIGTAPVSTETGAGIYYVSNVVGLNTGTVSYVFVRDNLEEDSKETPGIDLLYSTYHVSGLVAVNRGNKAHFSNSYYASSTVISASNTRPAEMQEILLENTGDIDNNTLFFYNSLIENYTSTSVRYGGAIDKTFNYNTRYGTYEESIAALNTAVVATNSNDSVNTWYTGSNYSSIGDLSTFLTSIITPVTRGFKTGQVSYSDNKYYVDINNENDLSYIYELMDTNSKFASNSFVYQLTADINLDNVLSPKYNNGIASTFKTKTPTDGYHTIYLNTLSYKVTTLGIDAYGVFPYLTGKVEYLNFVVGGNSQIEITNNSNNMIAYGAIAGYVEGGEINHCNVYNNIKIDSAAGKYYVGGAVGILAGEGTVSNTTTAGTITATNDNPKTSGYAEVSGYPDGVTVAGAIAYVDSSLGSVDSIYNTTEITATAYTNKEFTVGGVIGSAYFDTATKLQNNGTLTVSGPYSQLFASGVVGRLLGISNQISLFTNNGDLTVTQTNSDTYVSGILNADIQTNTTTSTTGLSESILKQKSKFYFYASAMTNGADIKVTGTNTSTLMYTNGINIMNSNGFITKLAGVYNLNYRFNATGTSLDAQEIDMNTVTKFSPVILSNSTDSNDYIDLNTIYNLRDIEFNQTSSVSSDLTYTGCVLGNHINYTDVRNEGNLTMTVTNTITGNIKIFGVFEVLSANNLAAGIYNGGNIALNFTAQITGDIYISGICYSNNNESLQDIINNYNPNDETFDDKLLGAFDNVINSGNLTINNSNYAGEGITYSATEIQSANGQQQIGMRHTTTSSAASILGNINVAGITNINKSIITNTFNIGDIFVANFARSADKYINTAGLIDLNIGAYAYVLNSANNGIIKAINLSSSTIATITAAGIIARNDLTESMNAYASNNSHSKQVVAFTINYGSIYSYNFNENIVGSNAEPHAISSGIVGMGLLNVINILNYGNIFGSETISGIFGVVYFARFQNEVTSTNKVKIANTINYGNTLILYRGYNAHEKANDAKSKGHYDHNIIRYDMFKEMDLNYSTFEYDDTKNRIDYANYLVSREVSYKSINGSIFSIINFNGNTNAQYVTIRYLINFEENAPLVGYEPNTPSSVPVDRSTIYSAYHKIDTRNNGSGQLVRDTYMSYNNSIANFGGNNYVVYAPLTNETNSTVKAVISNSTVDVYDASEVTTRDYEYDGVFSHDFEFYKAIIKAYSQAEINTNPTDAFLADFFQFVEYSYINEILVEKIGWKEIAYIAAANAFARSTSNINLLLTKLSSDNKNYSSYTTYALANTGIWTKWATNETLKLVINELIDNGDIDNLAKMLEYLFSSDSSSNVLINQTTRQELYNLITEKLSSEILTTVFANVLTYQNGYSKALSDTILDKNSTIYTFINTYIKSLDYSDLKSLLSSYLTILDNKNTAYSSNESSNTIIRYDILNSLFNNINDTTFYLTLCDILDVSTNGTIDSKLKMYEGYNTLNNNDINKYELFLRILEYSNETQVDTYLTNLEGEVGFFARLAEINYTSSSMSDIYSLIGTDKTSGVDEGTITERVNIWNRIKNTNTFKKYLKSVMTDDYYYFLATEHNNTYQSTTAPSPDGSFTGDLSYFYTTSISPSTYFYGPYESANADGTNGARFSKQTLIHTMGTTFDTLENYQWHSLFIADSLKYVDTYFYYNFNTNTFDMYTNQTTGYTNEIGTERIKGVLPAALYMYEIGYTGANNQFTGIPILKSNYYRDGRTDFDGQAAKITDFGGTTFKTTDAYITYNGITIPLSNATVSYHVNDSRDTGKFQIIDANGNQYTINSGFVIHDNEIVADSSKATNLTYLNAAYYTLSTANHTITYNNAGDRVWGDLLYRYGRNYYFSEVDSSYHKTSETGIYQRTGQGKATYTINNAGYISNKADVVWFTHKQGQKNPVYTTQYMDYTVDQLLELDGFYTNFGDGTTLCTDERNIINAIFNYHLCSNQATFEKIVRKALLELLGYSTFDYQTVVAQNWIPSYEITSASKSNTNVEIAKAEDGTLLWENNALSISNSVENIKGQFIYFRNYNTSGQTWYNTKYTIDFTINNVKFNSNGTALISEPTASFSAKRELQNAPDNVKKQYNKDNLGEYVSLISVNYSNTSKKITAIFNNFTQHSEDGDKDRRDTIEITFNTVFKSYNGNNILVFVGYDSVNAHAENGNSVSNGFVFNYSTHETRVEYTSNSITAFPTYWRNFNTGNGWVNSVFIYEIGFTNITFDKNGIVDDFDLSLSCNRITNGVEYQYPNNSIPSNLISYTAGKGFINLVFRLNTQSGNYDTVYTFLKFNVNKTDAKRTVNTFVNNPFTVNNNVISYNNSTIATLSVNNNQYNNITFNTTDYYYKNLQYSDDNRTVTFDYIPKSHVSINYIDQFMYSSIETNTLINDSIPLDTLNYDNTTTVKEYLESLTSMSSADLKTLIISSATNNEKQYYKLIDFLLNANVPSNNTELNEFTNLSTTIGLANTQATVYPHQITYDSKDYYYGFTVQNDGLFSLEATANKPIYVLSTNTTTNASYKYVMSYTNSTLGQSITSTETLVNINTLTETTIQQNRYIEVTTGVTEDNYESYYILDNVSYVHPISYDVNETYYFDSTENTIVTLIIYDIQNTAFYNIYQKIGNKLVPTLVTYTYNGTYYFTDSVKNGSEVNERFINPTAINPTNGEINPTAGTAVNNWFCDAGTGDMRSSYHLYSENELKNIIPASTDTTIVNTLRAIYGSNYISSSVKTSSIDEVNIQVALRFLESQEKNNRAPILMYSNVPNRPSPEPNGVEYGSQGPALSATNLVFSTRTWNTKVNEIAQDFSLSTATNNKANALRVGPYGDFIIGNHSAIALMPNYLLQSNEIDSTENHKLNFFDSLDEMYSRNGFTLTRTADPHSNKVGGTSGNYWTPTDADNASSFTYDATSILGQYLHAAQSPDDSKVMNQVRNGNRNMGIMNVMYKVTYSYTFDVTITDYELNDESILNDYYTPTMKSNYVGATLNGTNASSHKNDFADALTNLLPLNTNDYSFIEDTTVNSDNFDPTNLYEMVINNGNSEFELTQDTEYFEVKKYYKENTSTIKTIKNLLLDYLSNNPSGNYTLAKFYEYLICSSNTAFAGFLNAVKDASKVPANNIDIKELYKEILDYLLENNTTNGYLFVSDYINKYHDLSLTYGDKIITAAYIASDYDNIYQQTLATNNKTLLYNTQIRLLLDNANISVNGVSTKYINSNGTFDNAKFDALLKYLGLTGNNDVYGIYALAASHGIKNGQFIPDNLNLDTMDPGYTITNDIYTLTDGDTTDAAWRGGTGTGDAEDDDSDTDSVNYAFYDEMKQLIKSISTTVFELTLTKGTNTYYGDIDLDNHTITYYVTALETGSYTVSKLDLAYRATAYEGTPTTPSGTRFTDGSEEGTTASTITVTTDNTVENQFTVFAEDTKVHKTYDIIFKELNTNLTLVYDTTKTTGTTNNKNLTVESSTDDKKVVLDLTSTNSKLPLGFDLKPYLSFVLMSGNTETDTIYKMDSEYISISSLSSDHKVDISGNSEITLVVSYKLPAGTYRIKVAICNSSNYVTYVKEASHACDITSFKFNGNQLNISDNMTSSIKFGRAYNNIELTDVNGIYSDYDYDFYLDNIVISPNASITASVEKNQTEKSYRFDANTTVTYNITTYVVTYIVTAEDGTTTHRYTHTLTELDPYNTTVHTYGALFGDGNIINDANTEFNASGNSNQTVVSFERGNETYYRLKYVFTNIYTDNTVVYTKEETTTDVSLKGKATFNIEYHGISADVNEFCDAGTYSFLYKYSRPQVWGITVTDNGDGTYSFSEGTTTQIEYTFPRLVINKTYSTDATLHSIVLIDAYKYQSNASTAMDINVLRPIENPGNNEQYYQDLLTGDTTSNNIKVGNEIDYANNGTDYSTINYKDYYLVGTVSNAQLANYAPTFGIEKHGMIFQTTTLAKIKNYGKGKQDADEENILSDKAVLGDHNSADGATIYLYVPFTYIDDGETKNKIFLIQLNGKTLTNIYSDRYDGTTNSLGTLNRTLDELRIYKTSDDEIKVTIENVQYTLSKTVGDRIDNPSLYMDYIGNPIDDHFWFVSYVVFSEDYIRNTSSNTYLKFFHTALIDISNNVYFAIKVVTPNDAKFANINEIYITVVGKQYIEAENENEDDSIETIVVGAYVDKRIVDTTNQTITYELIYSIQILPSAYYFFYIDLPAGYEATSMVTDPNKVFTEGTSSDYLNHINSFPGAYLPPSSLVVQRVPLTITVTEGNEDASEWAIATSDIFTKNAKLILEEED